MRQMIIDLMRRTLEKIDAAKKQERLQELLEIPLPSQDDLWVLLPGAKDAFKMKLSDLKLGQISEHTWSLIMPMKPPYELNPELIPVGSFSGICEGGKMPVTPR